MSKISFTKQSLTYQQQLNQLINRGLKIKDQSKAFHLLETISYYRLSAYWYPLLETDKSKHIFKKDADFDNAFRLYCFDRHLRKLVVAELEKIEIAIRAKIVYVLSLAHGSFCFENSFLFKNNIIHATTLSKLGEEFTRSDEDFINAFRNKYSNNLPPAWMMCEIASFGIISMLYKNLKPGKEKKDIAHHFGLADKVFETWLHSIVYLRNVCAHHSRLWNRTMSIRPQIPISPKNNWLNNAGISNNKTYFMLCMINYLLQVIDKRNSFSNKLKDLLSRYPNVDTKAMGFSTNWYEEPLWQ